MAAKRDPSKHPDYQAPSMIRVQATRRAIQDAERELSKLREQLDDDVRAAMTPPAGEKLPYGRVKRLQLLFGYEDNSNLYRMRDRSVGRTEEASAKNATEEEKALGDGGNAHRDPAPGRTSPAAA